MTAKIIKFPSDFASEATEPFAGEGDGHSSLDIVIELANTEPSLFRNARVSADDSLADLHRVITGLFGWSGGHNYFFSQGSCRYEDPLLYGGQDQLCARYRKIYSAADVPVGSVLTGPDQPLFYVYNLVNCWELKIHLDGCAPFEPVAQEG